MDELSAGWGLTLDDPVPRHGGLGLVVLVRPQGGGTTGTEVTVTDRSISARLAYVLTWSAQPCAPEGPAGGGPTTCDLYDIVDARTGLVLSSFSTSRPS